MQRWPQLQYTCARLFSKTQKARAVQPWPLRTRQPFGAGFFFAHFGDESSENFSSDRMKGIDK